MMKYLKRANDEAICHCSCNDQLVSSYGQLDCPWCGCGWLFSCISCRKAFTFAEVIELDAAPGVVAARDVRSFMGEAAYRRFDAGAPFVESAEARVRALAAQVAELAVGTRVVRLDGKILVADQPVGAFRGVYATHPMTRRPPQTVMKDTPAELVAALDRPYWLKHRNP